MPQKTTPVQPAKPAQPTLPDGIEIFRAGRHTDDAGTAHEFSEAVLQEMASGQRPLQAIALGNGLPLVGEAVQASETGSLPATAFTYIFVACASSMALSLVLFHLMPERPLRGSVRDEPPVSME